mgnify:CR=1 FL=1
MSKYPNTLDIKKSHVGKKIFEISDARVVIKTYIEHQHCYTKELCTIKEDDFVLQSSAEDYGHFEIGDSDYDYEGVYE